MKLDLDREDLISLAKGQIPNYSAMDNPKISAHGSFAASYGRWDWNYCSFEKCSDEEIFEIYNICKQSWKN